MVPVLSGTSTGSAGFDFMSQAFRCPRDGGHESVQITPETEARLLLGQEESWGVQIHSFSSPFSAPVFPPGTGSRLVCPWPDVPHSHLDSLTSSNELKLDPASYPGPHIWTVKSSFAIVLTTARESLL